MLLATLSAFASVGGVTLPGVDPPARSSEAPKLLHGMHRLRAIAAIESWHNSNVSECSALEDMVRNASGLKVGSSLVFPKNHKDLCLRTNSVYDCEKAVELVRTVVREGGISSWCEANFIAPTRGRRLVWGHLGCLGTVVGSGLTCGSGVLSWGCAAAVATVPASCGDTVGVLTEQPGGSNSGSSSNSNSDSTCSHRSDGDCDDGGPGSNYDICPLGTDTEDCGPRNPCSNTCVHAYDGECDDGGTGADYSICSLHTDCADCTGSTTGPSSESCSNTCSHASDGDCDDGGPGAVYSYCTYGTDCADCGARDRSVPPPPPIPVSVCSISDYDSSANARPLERPASPCVDWSDNVVSPLMETGCSDLACDGSDFVSSEKDLAASIIRGFCPHKCGACAGACQDKQDMLSALNEILGTPETCSSDWPAYVGLFGYCDVFYRVACSGTAQPPVCIPMPPPPPSPSPPPPPSPSPPSFSSRAGSGGSSGGSTGGSSSYSAPSSNSKTIRIPRVVTRVLGGLGGAVVCCLLSYLRHVCKRATAAGGRSSEDEERNAPRGTPSSRSQTDPNAISVEMESASPSASVVLTPMSEVEREQYVCLYKSLGGCPVRRSEAAPTLERAQLPPDELDVIWELYEEHGQSVILAHRQSHSNCSSVDAWWPGPRGLTARYSRRQSVCTRANSGATRTLTGASMSRRSVYAATYSY